MTWSYRLIGSLVLDTDVSVEVIAIAIVIVCIILIYVISSRRGKKAESGSDSDFKGSSGHDSGDYGGTGPHWRV